MYGKPTEGFFSKGIVWLLSELVIVFVGVMLAFFVSGWQADKNKKVRSVRTLKILESELSDFHTYGQIPFDRMRTVLDSFEVKREAGEIAFPAYYREPRAPTSPMEAWHAVVESGAYELLEDSLFYALSLHYNRVTHLNDRFMRYTLETEEIIMPYLHKPAAFFYEEDLSRLKSEYGWHVRQLEETADELSLLIVEAGNLQALLDKQIDWLQ